jgi:hypothetical protein
MTTIKATQAPRAADTPGIRDLASLSKTLARNRKSCTGVAATKGRQAFGASAITPEAEAKRMSKQIEGR